MNRLISLSNTSVGIIGGADGPTAVVVSSSASLIATVIAVAVILAAAVGLIIALCHRKH